MVLSSCSCSTTLMPCRQKTGCRKSVRVTLLLHHKLIIFTLNLTIKLYRHLLYKLIFYSSLTGNNGATENIVMLLDSLLQRAPDFPSLRRQIAWLPWQHSLIFERVINLKCNSRQNPKSAHVAHTYHLSKSKRVYSVSAWTWSSWCVFLFQTVIFFRLMFLNT